MVEREKAAGRSHSREKPFELGESDQHLLQVYVGSGDCNVLTLPAKILDTLEMYVPKLKGLQHVHSFVCERLASLVFDINLPREHVLAFGYLYGQAMGLSPITGEGAALAVENLYVRPVASRSSPH